MAFRTGIAYDVHRFGAGLPLYLGGVLIPFDRGLIGHSDADVLLHAVCDALLGALALGDIGLHFPDTFDDFKGIDSKILLHRTWKMVQEKSWTIGNIDAVLILEKPKIQEFIPKMRKVIAGILETDIENVSVKATTTEKLGFTGREEGVAAQVIVLLER